MAEDTDVCVEEKPFCEKYNSSGKCIACQDEFEGLYQLAEDTDVCIKTQANCES